MSFKKYILRREKEAGHRMRAFRRQYNTRKTKRMDLLQLMGGEKDTSKDVEKTLTLAERIQAETARYLSMIDQMNKQKDRPKEDLSLECKKRKKTRAKRSIPICESDGKCLWIKYKGCFPNPKYFKQMHTNITWKEIEEQAALIDKLKEDLKATETAKEIRAHPEVTTSVYNKMIDFIKKSWNMGVDWLYKFQSIIRSLMTNKYTYIIGLASYVLYCYFYGDDCYGQEHLILLWNTITGESVAEPIKQQVKSWWGLGGTAAGVYASNVAYTSLCATLGPGAPVCVAGAIAWNVQLTSAIAFGAFGSQMFGSTVGEAHGESIKQGILKEYMQSMQNGFTLISAYIINNPEIVTAVGISTATAVKVLSMASLTASLKANYHSLKGSVFGKAAKTHVKMISAVAPPSITAPMQQVVEATVDDGEEKVNCGIRLKTKEKIMDGETIPKCEDPPRKCKWIKNRGCVNIL